MISFSAVNEAALPWPYVMTDLGNSSWVYTTSLPSGTYSYAFFADCPQASWSLTSGQAFFDPDNPPFVEVPGDQLASTSQVPYDDEFQYY